MVRCEIPQPRLKAVMTTTTLPVTQVLAKTGDVLLADVAIRVQLSPTAYDEAVARHEAIKRWIERTKSPLYGCVEHFYPQGSMATRSTIASKLRTDEFDIDIVAALLLAADTPAAQVLDLLYEAIRAEPGSRYYDMAERRTRCITVHYADGMHLDVTSLLVGRRHRSARVGFFTIASEHRGSTESASSRTRTVSPPGSTSRCRSIMTSCRCTKLVRSSTNGRSWRGSSRMIPCRRRSTPVASPWR
jgi:hypothetical protein